MLNYIFYSGQREYKSICSKLKTRLLEYTLFGIHTFVIFYFT